MNLGIERVERHSVGDVLIGLPFIMNIIFLSQKTLYSPCSVLVSPQETYMRLNITKCVFSLQVSISKFYILANRL